MKRGGAWVIAQFALICIYLAMPWRRPHPDSTSSIFGFILLGLGAIFFLAGIAALGRSLTPLPVPSESARLITSGAFRLVRHPIYSGLIFAAFGWALATHDTPRLLLSGALLVFFDAKARLEERALAERFPDYASYRHRVNRFIPWIY